MCLLYIDNVKNLMKLSSLWTIIVVLEARQISIRPARYSTWLFLFFKWSNFSPLNFVKLTTQYYIGSLSHGVYARQQEVDLMDSWGVDSPKFTGKFSLIEKTLRYTNVTGNHVYRSHLIRSRRRLRQQEIWVRDYLISLMRTQKRAGMTELDFWCPISRSAVLCSLSLEKLAVRSACVVVKAVVLLLLNLRLTFF